MDGAREDHLLDLLDEARMARREERTWEEESAKGSERYRGVGGYDVGVDAVDDGDDPGLVEAEPIVMSFSMAGIQTCWPDATRLK